MRSRLTPLRLAATAHVPGVGHQSYLPPDASVPIQRPLFLGLEVHRAVVGLARSAQPWFALQRQRDRGDLGLAAPHPPRGSLEWSALAVGKQLVTDVDVCLLACATECDAGRKIRARIGASEISFWHDGHEVARHERLTGKHQISAKLDRYLDLLARKPGALARSLALHQQRDPSTPGPLHVATTSAALAQRGWGYSLCETLRSASGGQRTVPSRKRPTGRQSRTVTERS